MSYANEIVLAASNYKLQGRRCMEGPMRFAAGDQEIRIGVGVTMRFEPIEPNFTRRGFLQVAATAAAGVAGAQVPAIAGGETMQDSVEHGGRRLYADRAKALIEALQHNWFHAQPIPGWGAE